MVIYLIINVSLWDFLNLISISEGKCTNSEWIDWKLGRVTLKKLLKESSQESRITISIYPSGGNTLGFKQLVIFVEQSLIYGVLDPNCKIFIENFSSYQKSMPKQFMLIEWMRRTKNRSSLETYRSGFHPIGHYNLEFCHNVARQAHNHRCDI